MLPMTMPARTMTATAIRTIFFTLIDAFSAPFPVLGQGSASRG